jgi:hypothetical protein
VQEAVERLLAEDASREIRIKDALTLEGTMGNAAADELAASIERIRGSWR